MDSEGTNNVCSKDKEGVRTKIQTIVIGDDTPFALDTCERCGLLGACRKD